MSGKLTRYEPDAIGEKIFTIRGQKVILDFDLAEIYGVPTKRLNEQIKRNKNRFPEDFMFQLTPEEATLSLQSKLKNKTLCEQSNRSQIATGSQRHRDPRFMPYAFTEHGAAMAANVLNSQLAIEMSIFIVRAFIRLRQMLLGNKELRQELEEMKKTTDDRFQIVFETLDHLLAIEERPKREIGFTVKEKRATYAVKQKAKADRKAKTKLGSVPN
jgi:hypothetical protein